MSRSQSIIVTATQNAEQQTKVRPRRRWLNDMAVRAVLRTACIGAAVALGLLTAESAQPPTPLWFGLFVCVGAAVASVANPNPVVTLVSGATALLVTVLLPHNTADPTRIIPTVAAGVLCFWVAIAALRHEQDHPGTPRW